MMNLDTPKRTPKNARICPTSLALWAICNTAPTLCTLVKAPHLRLKAVVSSVLAAGISAANKCEKNE